MERNIVLLCVVLFFLPIALSLDNGLGRTPPMGWNSWNHFGCNINDNLIRQTASAIATGPLKDAGYTYVNLDDCWMRTRDSSGNIQPDTTKFPNGIKPLADYVHSLGLKFGVYSDAGTATCQGRPGSLNYEKNDANSYASWGVDYLKYDNCNPGSAKPEVRYPVMRDALNATGRHIFFSMCEWGADNVATWAAPVGNSWRTTGDISDNWKAMTTILDLNDQVAGYAGPGGFNDPDMLEVGNGGMTTAEYTSHFSLWALVKSPLLIGCDVTRMSTATVNILTNKEVIAINQDPLGVQGKRVARTTTSTGNLEVWAGPLADKSVAAILFNRADTTNTITAHWSDLKLANTTRATVRDLWAKVDRGTFSGSYAASVPTHSVVMLKITPIA